MEGAHEKGTPTSSIIFTADGRQVATRGGDGTVKRALSFFIFPKSSGRLTSVLLVWDARSFKKPLFTASSLPSLNPESNIVFSPDEKYILTGTAGSHAGVLAGAAEEEKAKELERDGGVGGKVVVLKREGLEVVRSLSTSSMFRLVMVRLADFVNPPTDVSPFSVVKVLWHPTINQVRPCPILTPQRRHDSDSYAVDSHWLLGRLDPRHVLAAHLAQGRHARGHEGTQGARRGRLCDVDVARPPDHHAALAADVQGRLRGPECGRTRRQAQARARETRPAEDDEA